MTAVLGALMTFTGACALGEDDVDPASAVPTTETGGASAAAAEAGDAAPGPAPTETPGGPGGTAGASADPAPVGETGTDGPGLGPGQIPSDQLPVDVEISGTGGLADGDEVVLTATARAGSQIFALEVRLCVGGVTVESDADTRPSVTGKCVTGALSPVSDGFVVAQSEPPHEAVELRFRVGVGEETYTTQFGEPATVRCDQEHPCQLAVKFQVPDGYGFRTYPLDYR